MFRPIRFWREYQTTTPIRPVHAVLTYLGLAIIATVFTLITNTGAAVAGFIILRLNFGSYTTLYGPDTLLDGVTLGVLGPYYTEYKHPQGNLPQWLSSPQAAPLAFLATAAILIGLLAVPFILTTLFCAVAFGFANADRSRIVRHTARIGVYGLAPAVLLVPMWWYFETFTTVTHTYLDLASAPPRTRTRFFREIWAPVHSSIFIYALAIAALWPPIWFTAAARHYLRLERPLIATLPPLALGYFALITGITALFGYAA